MKVRWSSGERPDKEPTAFLRALRSGMTIAITSDAMARDRARISDNRIIGRVDFEVLVLIGRDHLLGRRLNRRNDLEGT